MTIRGSLATPGGVASFQRTGLTCQACLHRWFQDTPCNVPIAAYAAFMGALKCPTCGSGQVSFGYTPDPAESAAEAAADHPTMTDEERYAVWLKSGDTGLSSDTLARTMAGIPGHSTRFGSTSPSDPDDLGRCLRLLQRFPMWEDRVGEMAAVSRSWAALAGRWSELHDCMQQEVGLNWEKGRSAPKTYALMKAVLTETPDVVA